MPFVSRSLASRSFAAPALLLALAVAGVLGTPACASSSAFEEGGYRQKVFGYGVRYGEPSKKVVLGKEWQLDNFRYSYEMQGLAEKTGDDYVAERVQDLNRDGTIGLGERWSEPIYDLKLVSKTNNGVIWTKAHPILPEDSEQSLDVILDGYADSLAGAGLFAQGNLFSIARPSVRNFTTFLGSRVVGKVGDHEALIGTIQIAEVDKLKLDPTHRSGIVKLALLKLRYFTPIDSAARSSYPIVVHGGRPCHARVGLLVIGYHNTPRYFADGEKDFDDLLARVTFPDAKPLPTALAAAALAPAAAPPAPPAPSSSPVPGAPPAPPAGAAPAAP
jgi:hypothetical protein